MSPWQTLADALIDEDRRLRRKLITCPPALRERRGPHGSLSLKEILGHIAFWDDFTVRFFTARLDPAQRSPDRPVDFDVLSRQAIAEARQRPFGEVLAGYLEATGALVGFIANHWDRLGEQEREDFWVPLKHRRHHRIELEQAMAELATGGPAEVAAEA